jgi:hypothetical protein
MTLPKHVREALRIVGLRLSDVEFVPGGKHPAIRIDGRVVTRIAHTPRHVADATRRMVRDLRAAMNS